MNETVELPWIDEPVELSEAIELIARADESDEETIEDLVGRVERLERRIARLEDGSTVECPSCGQGDQVYKASVGAALLARNGVLSDTNAHVLNQDSHICLDCREAFTPPVD